MTNLEIFNKLMLKAKANGYTGDDYRNNIGFILDGTNIYSLIFREDFARALWGNEILFQYGCYLWEKRLQKLVLEKDKWKYLEENVTFD